MIAVIHGINATLGRKAFIEKPRQPAIAAIVRMNVMTSCLIVIIVALRRWLSRLSYSMHVCTSAE
jgi:hypothetical protein